MYRVRHLTTLWLALGLVGCGISDRLSVFDREVVPVPRLRFLTPDASGVDSDDVVQLTVQFDDVESGDTWDLFYLSDAGDTRGGVVGAGIAAKQGRVSLTWETATLAAGDYFLFAELTSAAGVSTAAAAGAVRIDHADEGNLSPTVRLISPNGGESFDVGAEAVVTWTATDPDDDPLTATVSVSRDSGTTWATIAADESDDSLVWTIDDSFPEANSYRVRVTVDDGKSGAAVDASDGDFTVVRPITWEADIAPMMAVSCGGAACHAANGTYGNVFNADDYADANGKGVSQLADRVVVRAMDQEDMPPAGLEWPPLSETDKARFRDWMANGLRE